MNTYDDYTCRLYIEGDWSLNVLIDMIKDHTDGDKSVRTIVAQEFEIDLENSQDADSHKLNDDDGFLFYRFGGYVEPSSKVEPKAYIEALSKLIVRLREDGALVVASCDFEKEISRLTGWNWSSRKPKQPEV